MRTQSIMNMSAEIPTGKGFQQYLPFITSDSLLRTGPTQEIDDSV